MKVWSAGEKVLASDLNANFRAAGGANRTIVLSASYVHGTYFSKSMCMDDFSADDPTSVFVAITAGGTNDIIVEKYTKDTDGFMLSRSVTANIIQPGGNNNGIVRGITCKGTYVYVFGLMTNGGGSYVPWVTRLDQSNLGNQTTITGFSVSTTDNNFLNAFFYDPVTDKFWYVYNATTVKGGTISGTAFTVTDTITLSTGLSNIYNVLYKNSSGNFIILDIASSGFVQTVRRYQSNGTLIDSLSRGYAAQHGVIDMAIGVIKLGGSVNLAICRAFEISSNFFQEILFRQYPF
jgi:hypothetical protein